MESAAFSKGLTIQFLCSLIYHRFRTAEFGEMMIRTQALRPVSKGLADVSVLKHIGSLQVEPIYDQPRGLAFTTHDSTTNWRITDPCG